MCTFFFLFSFLAFFSFVSLSVSFRFLLLFLAFLLFVAAAVVVVVLFSFSEAIERGSGAWRVWPYDSPHSYISCAVIVESSSCRSFVPSLQFAALRWCRSAGFELDFCSAALPSIAAFPIVALGPALRGRSL